MTIKLNNEILEAKIREIGRRTGEGPSATIARMVAIEEERLRQEKRALVAERAKAIKRLRAVLPKLTKVEKATIRQAIDDIHDEDGLPR